MMRCCSKEQIIDRITVTKPPNSSPKTDKELCHICPAKLSKRELEDLYFMLLQNNLDLKKNLNRQTEKIKVLSTKLQRMTATQKTFLGKEGKECCGTTKAVVQEQIKTIADLSRTNDQLQEQIKQLNMKLCSTKQFLRRSSGQPSNVFLQNRATSHMNTHLGGKPANSSTSALNTTRNDDVTNIKVKSVSCQCLEKMLTNTSKSTETCVDQPAEGPRETCDEIRCKTLMEELKLKIVNLQEELSKAHSEYCLRMSRLEHVVEALHEEKEKAHSDTAARKHSLNRQEEETREIKRKLRDVECQCGILETQLTIEKGRVAEMETQVRAANMTTEAVKNVENHIISNSNIEMMKSPREAFLMNHCREPGCVPTSNKCDEEPLTENKEDASDGYNAKSIEAIREQDSDKDVATPNIESETRICEDDARKNMMGDVDQDTRLRRTTNDSKNERKQSIEGKQTFETSDGSKLTLQARNEKKLSVEEPEKKLSLDSRNQRKQSIDGRHALKQTFEGRNEKRLSIEMLGERRQSIDSRIGGKQPSDARVGSKQSFGRKLSIEVPSVRKQSLDSHNDVKRSIEMRNGSKLSHELRDERRPSVISHNERKQSMETTELVDTETHSPGGDNVDSKPGDDSGYTELNGEDESAVSKGLMKLNKALMSKIADLQSQLDSLRITMLTSSDHYAIDMNEATKLTSTRDGIKVFETLAAQAAREEETTHQKHGAQHSICNDDEEPLACGNSCGIKSLSCDMECRDVVKDEEVKKDRRDVCSRNQSQGSIPVSSPSKKPSLSASELSFCKKFKSYREKKEKLKKLEEMDDSDASPGTQSPQAMNRRSTEEKQPRLSSSKIAEQKKNFHTARDSGEATSRHSRCFLENPYPGERGRSISTQSVKETPISTARSARETQKNSNAQNTRENLDQIIKQSSRDSQITTKVKEGSAHRLANDTTNLEVFGTEEEFTMTTTDVRPNSSNESLIGKKQDARLQSICMCTKKEAKEPPKCACENLTLDSKLLHANATMESRSKRSSLNGQKTATTQEKMGTRVSLDLHGNRTSSDLNSRAVSSNQQNATGLRDLSVDTQGNVGVQETSRDELSQRLTNMQNTSAGKRLSADIQSPTADRRLSNQISDQSARRLSASSRNSGPVLRRTSDASNNVQMATNNSQDVEKDTRSYKEVQSATGPSLLNLPMDHKEREICCGLKQNEGPIEEMPNSLSYPEGLQPQATSSPYPAREVDTKDQPMQASKHNSCDDRIHVCSCPSEKQRPTPIAIGPCSYTLRLQNTGTFPSSFGFRSCNCPTREKKGEHKVDGATQIENQAHEKHQSSPPASEASVPKTYTLPGYPGKCSRSTSPENTDQEISFLSDLPTENNDKSSFPRNHCIPTSPGENRKYKPTEVLSPGEDRHANDLSTSTYSETTSPTTPTAPTAPLSEGELRTGTYHADLGPKSTPKLADGNRKLRDDSSSSKVEAALAQISTELVRCRQLLMQARPHQDPNVRVEDPGSESFAPDPNPPVLKSCEVPEADKKDRRASLSSKLWMVPGYDRFREASIQQPPDKTPEPPKPLLEDSGGGNGEQTASVSNQPSSCTITLKRIEGKPRIGDAYTPRVMFTLHIGTVVLSDEAVINSRELSLVLTWQFYEQNVAMCRLRPGRVIPFDFSTEYDLKLSDEFLEYLKSEELPIKICEENKLDVPFASCSLPLREALLHTNRRADMSLALIAGPRTNSHERAADALDQRDELGVLDLWCMLRADPRLLPTINKAIALSYRPSKMSLVQSIMTQINDDDQDEIRISADLEPLPIDRLPEANPDVGMNREVSQQTENPPERAKDSKYGYRDSANFPVYRPAEPEPASLTDVTSMDIKNTLMSTQDFKPQVSFEDKWASVESRRRSSGIIVNEVPTNIKTNLELKRALERTYNERSARQSITKSEATSLGKGKRPAEKIQLAQPSAENYLNNTPYANLSMIKQSDAESIITQTDVLGDNSEFTKKYDFVSGVIGSKKAAEASRRVTIKKEGSISIAPSQFEEVTKSGDYLRRVRSHSLDVTVLWLALNEECTAMGDPSVQRLYVAYTFLGRGGAELETPISLPKPKQYQDKCHFNFRKSFQLTDSDLPTLGRMAKCRSPMKGAPNPRESIVFTVVSEPVEDPLGINNCEDIGNAHLYLGDLLAYSAGSDTYTEVIPVRATVADDIIGVLAIRVDGLDVVRKCVMLSSTGDDGTLNR